MKNPAKAIKIVSIIMIVFGILAAIMGILFVAGGGIGASFAGNADFANEINSSLAENSEAASALSEFNNAAGTNLTGSEATMGLMGGAIILGILVILGAIFDIVAGCFGLKAAKGGNAKPAFVIGIITIIFAVINLITSFNGGGSSIVSSLFGFILPIIYTFSAKQLKDNK